MSASGLVSVTFDDGERHFVVPAHARHPHQVLPQLSILVYEHWVQSRPWTAEAWEATARTAHWWGELAAAPVAAQVEHAATWTQARIGADGRLAFSMATREHPDDPSDRRLAVRLRAESRDELFLAALEVADQALVNLERTYPAVRGEDQFPVAHARAVQTYMVQLKNTEYSVGTEGSPSLQAWMGPSGNRRHENEAVRATELADLPWSQRLLPPEVFDPSAQWPGTAAKYFTLLAHTAPGTRTVEATDLHNAESIGLIETGRLRGQVEAQMLGDAGYDASNLQVWTHPDIAHDIAIEQGVHASKYSWGVTAGYIEHNPVAGSRYVELGEDGPPGPSMAALLAACVEQRTSVLTSQGWARARPAAVVGTNSSELGLDRSDIREARVAAACADVLAAVLANRPRADLAAACDRIGPTTWGNNPQSHQALVGQWGYAWAAEQLGVDGATAARKRVEHALLAVDTPMMHEYYRRCGHDGAHQAMIAACEATGPDQHAEFDTLAVFDRVITLAQSAGITPGALADKVMAVAPPHQGAAAGFAAIPTPEAAGTLTVGVHFAQVLAARDTAFEPVLFERAAPAWVREPDTARFTLDVDGSTWRAFAERSPVGAWAATLAVPAGHPLEGVHHDDPPADELDVHGGLSWSGRVDGTWRLGFDCGHIGDYTPFDNDGNPENYRDLAFVRRQLHGLAVQAHAHAPASTSSPGAARSPRRHEAQRRTPARRSR